MNNVFEHNLEEETTSLTTDYKRIFEIILENSQYIELREATILLTFC
jgi:hypothetical protein